MKKNIMICLVMMFITGSAHTAFSQTTFNPPKNPEFKTADDYAKYEGDIIKSAKWLEETDLDKEEAKRKDINMFVLMWLSGSPSVSLTINDTHHNLVQANVHLLGIYLAAYSAYVLQHKDDKGTLEPTKAGLLAMMNVYQKGIAIKKNKAMEKLIKMNGQGKIEEYIAKELK